jgi:hypothetical protein
MINLYTFEGLNNRFMGKMERRKNAKSFISNNGSNDYHKLDIFAKWDKYDQIWIPLTKDQRGVYWISGAKELTNDEIKEWSYALLYI